MAQLEEQNRRQAIETTQMLEEQTRRQAIETTQLLDQCIAEYMQQYGGCFLSPAGFGGD